MKKKLLITFGCSWTAGVGVGYNSTMSSRDFEKIAWNSEICDQLSFRALLSKKYNLENKNFSNGGSSNQLQFRQALEFFPSPEFQQLQKEYQEIAVLWGITSTARNELFFNSVGRPKNFLYTDGSPESQAMIRYFYNHDYEIMNRTKKMQFWNDYFHCKGIVNLWFDTFNHHYYHNPNNKDLDLFQQLQSDYTSVSGPEWPKFNDYINCVGQIAENIHQEIANLRARCFENYPINNLIFKEQHPRDLMSQLVIANHCGTINYDDYHFSHWEIDSPRVKSLVDVGILNPYSHHPTELGHQQIANILSPFIENAYNF